MCVKNKSILAVPCILLLLFSFVTSAYANEGDSGIPGDYTQYISVSEATPYVEAEPSGTEQPALTEEEVAELERERAEAENTVIIKSLDEFNIFAANCSDRIWSSGKKVYLECDIDLGNEPFTPIAYFAGEFYGNRHTVSALNIEGNYARGGLFATLAKTAYLSELRVIGNVHGTGKAIVGGIAGENYGIIQNVIFQGSVVSEYTAGGIAGLNLENAYITDSKSGGSVIAPTCAGGIAADNRGELISCENHASVSTGSTGIDRIFERKDHIGVISGYSSGREESCVNLSVSSPYLFSVNKQKLSFIGLIAFGVTFLSGAVALIILLFGDSKKE